MKAIMIGVLALLGAGMAFEAYAKDVYVRGYYRKNGTYVQPYVRSSPDSSLSNNYGPSTGNAGLGLYSSSPQSRDYDGDGTPNYLDNDDNNNGIYDNQDADQY